MSMMIHEDDDLDDDDDDDDDDGRKRREWKMRGVYWRRVNRVSIRPPLALFPQNVISSEFFSQICLFQNTFARSKNPNHKKGTQKNGDPGKRRSKSLYILPNIFNSKCTWLADLILALALLLSLSLSLSDHLDQEATKVSNIGQSHWH